MIVILDALRKDCLEIADMIASPALDKARWLEYAQTLERIIALLRTDPEAVEPGNVAHGLLAALGGLGR